MSENTQPAIYSIGHGNRSAQEFLALLKAHAIDCLVDVRAYPVSRHNPQFCRDALEGALVNANLHYVWEGKTLGGRRKARADSPHIALPADIRGFADHMASVKFQNALKHVEARALRQRVCFMCAELKPAQCHRSLIADALTVGGFDVRHIIDEWLPETHLLSKLAHVQDAALIYDLSTQQSLL